MLTVAIHSGRNAHAGRCRAARAAQRGEPFRNSTESLTGRPIASPAHVGTGVMPSDEAARFLTSGADYVIKSYSTPIAYRVEGVWIIPDVRYSRTTSLHQSFVRLIDHYAAR